MSNDISSCLNSEAPNWPLFVILYYLQFRREIVNLLENLNGFRYKSFKLTNAYKLTTKKGVYLGRVSKENILIIQNKVTQQHWTVITWKSPRAENILQWKFYTRKCKLLKSSQRSCNVKPSKLSVHWYLLVLLGLLDLLRCTAAYWDNWY